MDKLVLAEIRGCISNISGLNPEEVIIEIPKENRLGDYAFPCFILAKTLKKSPNSIADEFASKIKENLPKGIETVKSTGPYVNFFLNPSILANSVLNQINEKNNDFGKGEKKTDKVMVEYCQVNTHKAFHVGHLRGTLLGYSLVRLLKFSGYEVVSANYQGDIGSHVAKSLWYLTQHYIGEYPEENKGIWLGQIYQKANALIAENPEIYKHQISEVLQKLEKGDKELTELWEKTRKWSLDDFELIYQKLNVSFDKYFFESQVDKDGKKLVMQMLKKGLAYESDNAIVIDLQKYNLGVFLLLKSDGTALYSTKDLALAKRKFEEYKIDRSLYVVGSEQKFYFQQVFKTLELIGFKQAEKCFHLPYDLVTLEGGKISSREGELILAIDLLNEITEHAKSEVSKRHPDWEETVINKTASSIALAGIKFGMVSVDNNRQIVFSVDRSLDFEGETGPYIQYAYARISSILRKNDVDFSDANLSLLKHEDEKNLVLRLANFPSVIEDCQINYRIMPLCKYLVDLSQSFNEYYHTHPILKSENEIMKARLYLISCVRTVLSNGLSIIGIDKLDMM